MRVLVLGCSSIFTRRALRGLLAAGAESIDVASRSNIGRFRPPATWQGRIFDDYSDALRHSTAELVYVSLVNSLHAEWAERSLDAGKHVVVDKPALTDRTQSNRLQAKAQARGLCLAEATVFADHPQIAMARERIAEKGGATRLIAILSVPPYPAGDHRNIPELGGGALNDLGPYAAACSRLLFGDLPERIQCHSVSVRPGAGIDTAFSLLAAYSGGRCYVGHFGFDTEYKNEITVIGPRIDLRLVRAFTMPPDLDPLVSAKSENEELRLRLPRGDTFEAYFRRLFGAIRAGGWHDFSQALERDAAFRDQLQRAVSSAQEKAPRSADPGAP